ncbi:MAG: hypothetical protein JWM60_1664 [Solirubrobacterales bacterium]|nr:hypothetical protein [Solirubrobacterales bacterium]
MPFHDELSGRTASGHLGRTYAVERWRVRLPPWRRDPICRPNSTSYSSRSRRTEVFISPWALRGLERTALRGFETTFDSHRAFRRSRRHDGWMSELEQTLVRIANASERIASALESVARTRLDSGPKRRLTVAGSLNDSSGLGAVNSQPRYAQRDHPKPRRRGDHAARANRRNRQCESVRSDHPARRPTRVRRGGALRAERARDHRDLQA